MYSFCTSRLSSSLATFMQIKDMLRYFSATKYLYNKTRTSAALDESSMKIKFINISLVQKLVAIRCVENVETSFLAHLDSDAHLLQIIIRYGFVIKCMT